MIYQTLPPTYEAAQPVLQKIIQATAASVLPSVSTSKRPDPPRNLISQPGTGVAVITWNPPAISNDVAGWRVYKDNENNLYTTISDPKTLQVEVTLPANASTYVYVSSFNSAGRESIKVQVAAKSDGNQYTTSGVNGAVPGLPPGYAAEIEAILQRYRYYSY